MRRGKNPVKNNNTIITRYTHQVVIPVYIPDLSGYYQDSLEILKISLTSLFKTTHSKTFITIANNGSCEAVSKYLNDLYEAKKIQELIHTSNIGKANSILKAVRGHDFKLVTITDADVLFLNNWQSEAYKIFNHFPKAGVVGIVPQLKMFNNLSYNVMYDNFWNKKMAFQEVKNPEAIKLFYQSIGWNENYNKAYLKYHLCVKNKENFSAVVGSGHFVATYSKYALSKLPSISATKKMGFAIRDFIDIPVLKTNLWRLTTVQNYAYHLGNTIEPWMKTSINDIVNETEELVNLKLEEQKISKSTLEYQLKNKLFKKFIDLPLVRKWFYRYHRLPKKFIKDF